MKKRNFYTISALLGAFFVFFDPILGLGDRQFTGGCLLLFGQGE